MKKLDVSFNGWGQNWLLGQLADDGRALLFEYSEEALDRSIEFSPRHLKLRRGAYGDFPMHQHRLPGLVADALPDGWGLLLMDRLFRQHAIDPARLSPLDRLAFIGDRAMGALVFKPASDIELPTEEIALVDLAHEAQAVVADKDSTALKQLARLGGSPQGARPKVLVQFDADTGIISSVPHAAGAPWLVKFQANGEHKEVCAIEHLYAQLARNCGLQIPSTRHFDLDKKLAAFGIERFDRADDMRVPVHTLAGALHSDFRVPELGYATFLRFTRFLTKDEREVRKAFERCVFNVMFHHRDDHAKNFSYRMNRDMRWELAPCYDLTYCEGSGGEHQMDIMGEGRAPGKTHLTALAKDAGLDIAWASEVIFRITEEAGKFKEIADTCPIRSATVKTIAAAIEASRKRMV